MRAHTREDFRVTSYHFFFFLVLKPEALKEFVRGFTSKPLKSRRALRRSMEELKGDRPIGGGKRGEMGR